MKIRTLIAAALVVAMMPGIAMADAAVVAVPDAWTQITQLAGTFVAAVAVGMLSWFAQKYLGIKLDQHSQDTLESAMQNGLALAISRVAPTGLQRVTDKSQIVSMAMDYVNEHVPDAAANMKAVGQKLADKLEARLVQHPAAASVSPTTAPAPIGAD